MGAKIKIFFETSKQNARNLILFTENGCHSAIDASIIALAALSVRK